MDGAIKEKDSGLTEGLDQPSALVKLTSGIEEGKQYGGADVKKLVEDALSADGRVQKDRADAAEANVTRLTGELDGLTTQLSGLNTQMIDFTRAQNEAEADKVKEDPVALGSLRTRQANTSEKLRLDGVLTTQEAREAKQNQRDVDFGKEKTTFNIKLAAMAAGVDEQALANLVPDGDPSRLSQAATLIKAGTTPAIDPATGKPVVVPAPNQPTKPPGLVTTPASVVAVAGEHRSVSEVMLADAKAK